jgi:hypothetical protein
VARYLWHGYTCSCGERVPVFRFPPDQTSDKPMVKSTVRCTNGHERTVRVEEIEQLDYWLGSEFEADLVVMRFEQKNEPPERL